MRRRIVLPVVLAAVVPVSACSGTGSSAAPAGAVASASPTATAPAPVPASPSALPSPSASTSPSAAGFDVAAVQQQLKELRYFGGPVDGVQSPALRSAVMAFQKVQGLGADGTVGPLTLGALAGPKPAVLKATAPANRVEVDLTRQVLFVVKGGQIERIMPISSGNGVTYEQKDGSTAKALTPVGWYTIQRRIVGERKADLGTLYDPQYFYKGWAIHGSNSVPAYPASHGCVRVTRADAKWLLDAIGNGMSVYLYGGTHTFVKGSDEAGTDAPTGDGPEVKPEPSVEPSPTSPSPSPSEPSPSVPADPAPATPSPSTPAR